MKKVWIGLLILVGFLLILVWSQKSKFPIFTGYAAKKICSCTYIADRSKESIEQEDLSFLLLRFTSNSLDTKVKSATSSLFGLGKKTAVYRGRLGCVLLKGEDDHHVSYPEESTVDLPQGFSLVKNDRLSVDYAKLDAAVDEMFDADGAITDKKTRAVVVLYKDSIIAERYAKGIDKDTELLGWSMTKSLMNVWTGMMVMDSVISLEDNNLFDAWSADDRKNITLDNLLHMSSGLDWEEDYTKASRATTMLFDSEDIVATAITPSLSYTPGKHWCYSSGTSNIISGYLRSKFKNHNDYLRFPHERIFKPLGMNSAILESDESGNYIGSSYLYATARDWSKFGLFLLHDGVVSGERLLPEGWIAYSTEEVKDSDGVYGAQFWINKRGVKYPDAPYDMFICNGFQGQRVFVLPSNDLVIVRLGLGEDVDFNAFVRDVVASIKL